MESVARISLSKGSIAYRVFSYSILILITIIMVFPFSWLVYTSLKPYGEEFTIVASQLTFSNYSSALTTVPLIKYAWNTTVIVLSTTAGTLLTASMAAFAFARLQFPGREPLFKLLLSTMMLPAIITLVPSFILFRILGWINTLLPLTVPAWFGGGAFNIFLIRQFFLTLPRELDEAARMDGASTWAIFRLVALPLSQPVLATVAIFTFVGQWNDFLHPLIYLHDINKYTISLGLRMFQSEYFTNWTWIMAAAVMSMLPILVLFFAAQRYFVQGIQLSGLAGR